MRTVSPSARAVKSKQTTPATSKMKSTRQEWEDRQQAAPPELAQLLAAIRAEQDTRTAAERKRLEAEAAKVARSRQGFEKTIAATLKREGAEWLTPYRVPDQAWCGQWAFSPKHYSWMAVYDLTVFGLHPILVRCSCGDSGEQWFQDDYAFGVRFPLWERTFQTVAEAVAAAAGFDSPPCAVADRPATPSLARDLYRLLSRVRVKADEPTGRHLPILAGADLRRTAAPLLRQMADLIDAGIVQAEPGCFDAFQCRSLACLIEGK